MHLAFPFRVFQQAGEMRVGAMPVVVGAMNVVVRCTLP